MYDQFTLSQSLKSVLRLFPDADPPLLANGTSRQQDL